MAFSASALPKLQEFMLPWGVVRGPVGCVGVCGLMEHGTGGPRSGGLPWALGTRDDRSSTVLHTGGLTDGSPFRGLLHKAPHKHGRQAGDLKCEVRSHRHTAALLALQLIIHLSLSFPNHGFICAARRGWITSKSLCTAAPEPAPPFLYTNKKTHETSSLTQPPLFPPHDINKTRIRLKGPQLGVGRGRLGQEGAASVKRRGSSRRVSG